MLNTFDQTCFCIYIYQDYINTNLLNTIGADNIFVVSPKHAKYFAWTGYYNVSYTTSAYIKINIAYITKTDTIPTVYNLFLPQFTNAHINNHTFQHKDLCNRFIFYTTPMQLLGTLYAISFKK